MKLYEWVVAVFSIWTVISVFWVFHEKVIMEKNYPVGTFKALFRFVGANLFAYILTVELLPKDYIMLLPAVIAVVLIITNIICLGCIIAKNQALIYTQLVKNTTKETEDVIATEK